MEGVGRIPAVHSRIREGLDDLVELDHGTRPAVGDQQRHRVGILTAQVDEVDVEAVDLGDPLRETGLKYSCRAGQSYSSSQ